MRGILLLTLLFCTTSCAVKDKHFIELGSRKAKEQWVYLGGLTENFDSEDEIRHRQILHEIGCELNISFLAMVPNSRCQQFDNRLCWPQKNIEQVKQTFQSILKDIGNKKINGWVGFSNGAYFLHELILAKLISTPVITLGAAGRMDSTDQIHIMIGRQDRYAYNQAKILGYKIIEYDGGHAIIKDPLKNVLISFYNNFSRSQ